MNRLNGKNIGTILFTLIIILFLMSITLVASASVDASELIQKNSYGLTINHLIRVVLAFIFIVITSSIPYQLYKKFTLHGIILIVVLLLLQLFFGVAKKGAIRSLELLGIEIQVSFIAVYVLVFHLANLIDNKGDKVRNFKLGYLPMLFWILILTVLIFAQPNFSQGVLVFTAGMLIIFIGGGNLKHIISTVSAISPFFIMFLLSAEYRYQRVDEYIQRFISSFVEFADPQVKYSLIAMGSGGLLGVGIGKSRFREAFIPECYGDFIFSILGEEFGFIGVVTVLLIYLLIIGLGVIIILKTNDVFGKMIVGGTIIVLTLYVIVNTFVVIGFSPNTGLPLPFLSYGGSALIMHSIAYGVMINVASNIKSQENPRILFSNDSDE